MFKSKQGRCFLVAVEGADMLGKATQTALLEENLNKVTKAITVEVPWKDEATYAQIYKMLRDGTAVSEPVVFQTIQACNRRIMQTTYLPNLSAHFDVVILDRWTPSTWVYGTVAGIPVEQNKVILDGLVEPDVTLVLDGEPFEPESASDVYEKDRTFQRAVRAEYRRYAESHPETTAIFDAHQDRKVLARQLSEFTKRKLAALE